MHELWKQLAEESNSCRESTLRDNTLWKEVTCFTLVYVTFGIFVSSFLYVDVEYVEEPTALVGKVFENDSGAHWWRTLAFSLSYI